MDPLTSTPLTDEVLGRLCNLAVDKVSDKNLKKMATSGGNAMRKRLLIKNFVAEVYKLHAGILSTDRSTSPTLNVQHSSDRHIAESDEMEMDADGDGSFPLESSLEGAVAVDEDDEEDGFQELRPIGSSIDGASISLYDFYVDRYAPQHDRRDEGIENYMDPLLSDASLAVQQPEPRRAEPSDELFLSRSTQSYSDLTTMSVFDLSTQKTSSYSLLTEQPAEADEAENYGRRSRKRFLGETNQTSYEYQDLVTTHSFKRIKYEYSDI